MTTFQPQVRENHLVVSKLDSHLLSCCVVYALMYDAMYVLISGFCLFSHAAVMNNVLVECQIE